MRRFLILASALAGVAGFQAFAQTVEGLDLDVVRARAQAMGPDAAL